MKSCILIFLLVATVAFAQNSSSGSSPTVLQSEGGRFVFGQVGPMRADQYMLDTKTGRLWQIVLDEKKRTQLQAVSYIGIILGEETYEPDTADAVSKHREISQRAAVERIQQAMDEAKKQKK